MKKLANIFTTKVKLIIGALILLASIAFTEISQSGVVCQSVRVLIENNHENHFLMEEDVILLVTANGAELLEGQEIGNIDLKSIETRLNDNPYIEHGEIFKDLEGNLIVNISLKRPIARIIRNNGSDTYITESGDQMPVSTKYVSRVLLLQGYPLDTLNPSRNVREILPGYYEMISYIRDNEFWRMQVAEMEIQKNGELILMPQVTKQLVEFGEPVDFEEKFKKLKVFYQEVLPREGWNKYQRVNLKYNQQIIAE